MEYFKENTCDVVFSLLILTLQILYQTTSGTNVFWKHCDIFQSSCSIRTIVNKYFCLDSHTVYHGDLWSKLCYHSLFQLSWTLRCRFEMFLNETKCLLALFGSIDFWNHGLKLDAYLYSKDENKITFIQFLPLKL